MQDPSKRFVWLAGEASGDFLASLVMPSLAGRFPNASQSGIGGIKMREAGLESWFDMETLSVRGYVEVIKKLPAILRLRQAMFRKTCEANPDLFIGVDAPDFNLGMEMKLRQQGIRTMHLVSPSIWAWRPQRIETVRRAAEHVLLIFPFEKAIYDKARIPSTYIGHPLAGIIPMKPDAKRARMALGISARCKAEVFAILPGSRIDEVNGCAPIFFQAADIIRKRLGTEVHFLVAALDAMREARIRNLLTGFPELSEQTTIVRGRSHLVMEASDAVLAASGTATLEAALYKKPVVVGYTMPALSAWIMQHKALIGYVSLPNILLGEPFIPEFLHYFCQSEYIATSLVDQLEPKRLATIQERFQAMHETLLRPTGDLALEAIERLLRSK